MINMELLVLFLHNISLSNDTCTADWNDQQNLGNLISDVKLYIYYILYIYIYIYIYIYCKFIQFDIKEFYPAISEAILGKAINFAKEFIDIESFSLRTIQHCR